MEGVGKRRKTYEVGKIGVKALNRRRRSATWIAVSYVITALAEFGDLFLSYQAFELLLGGNLTGEGLATEAERIAGFQAGVGAAVIAIVMSALVLVLSIVAGRVRNQREGGGRGTLPCFSLLP